MDSKLHILQHSLGVDQYGNGVQHRNHFVTGPGGKDHADCMALVEMGLMANRGSSALTGGSDCFIVTRAGKDYMSLNSPVPPPQPKLTKSKMRYQRYLEYGDMFDRFIDFCRWDADPERSWNGGRV